MTAQAAGVPGLEPGTTVLETVMIAISPYPRMAKCSVRKSGWLLLTFFAVLGVLAAVAAMFFEFQLVAILAPQIAGGVVIE